MRHLRMYKAIQLIHRAKSIRAAAHLMSASPSALNRSVQAFEDELGFEVFERIPGGVRLSDAGELLLHLIDRHMIEFGELQRELGMLRDGDVGELRISLGTDISAGKVMAAIAEVEEKFTGLSIEVVSDDTSGSLRRRQVQLAVLTNPITDDAVEVLYGYAAPLVGLAHKDMSAPTGYWEFAQTRMLLPMEQTGSRAAIRLLMRRKQIELKMVSTITAALVSQRLRNPSRIAVFPEVVLDGDLSSNLQTLPLDFGSVQVCALRASGLPVTRPAQTFLTALQRCFEETSDTSPKN